jgi:hypothetical protein
VGAGRFAIEEERMFQRTRRAARRPKPLPTALLGLAIWLLALALARPVCAQQIAMDPHICRPGERQFTVALAIGTGAEAVVGIELEVAFDPGKLALQGIDAGSWVTGSGLEYFFYDHTVPGTSTIHLTMAFLGAGRIGTGQLAVCRFRALAEGTIPLEFVHLDVRGVANVDLGFVHSTGDVVIIEPAIAVDEISWGAVKSQYR